MVLVVVVGVVMVVVVVVVRSEHVSPSVGYIDDKCVHWPCMVHITMQPWTANLDRNLYPLARNGGCTNNNELAQFSVGRV